MTPDLHIYAGNHLEVLVDFLAKSVRNRPVIDAGHALVPEIVVVQSKGMQRWISMAIAGRNGICANMHFPFPNTFLESIYAKVFGSEPERFAYYDTHVMTFRIMAILGRLIHQREFAPIRDYLAENASPIKKYQLARKIADVFDQYLVFRPETILSWEKGSPIDLPPEHSWQPILWNQLRQASNTLHRAELQKRLVRRLIDSKRAIANLPPRISVFGISYLPIFHLQVLEALAYRIQVNLFLLNPCRQYWADIVSDRQLIRTRKKSTYATAQPTSLHMERGNRLLASWGNQGRSFFGLTQELDGRAEELFEDNSTQTLLGRIQQDILDLVDGPRGENGDALCRADGSLMVNVCHSPMREVEVLRQQLMDILDTHADINPSDILVMTPDIGRYAPYVHAVFGRFGHQKPETLPYTVADQSIHKASRLADAFLRILYLVDSRFEASQVMALLEYASIRKRFKIAAGDCAQIESWIREVNIRWGWDGRDRQRQRLPRYSENTWRAGLDRLLLGYALSSGREELFAGIALHEGVEGSDSQLLGSFIHFAETLYGIVHQMPSKADLRQWFDILAGVLKTIFEPDTIASREYQILMASIEPLERIGEYAFEPEPVSFEVVREFLQDHLNQPTRGTGFLGGGITFCAMLPMRSIPAKVVCLLGMQHDAFPQDIREPGFNLVAQEPRPGDRSKRDDDKYLFLEALLSARRLFYISYIGRDIQDNASKPPAVLVNELLEYVSDEMGIDAAQLVTEHPLQSFSPSYFDLNRPDIFSYSKADWEASQSIRKPAGSDHFFHGPIPAPPDPWRSCDLKQFVHFFAHPIQFLMEQRLGIDFKEFSDPLADAERFSLDPLDSFLTSQHVFKSIRAGRSHAECHKAIQAAGLLPHGNAGLAAYDDVYRDVQAFMSTLDELIPTEQPKTLQLDIELPPFHLSGQMTSIYPQAMLVYRLAKLRPRDLLSTFIQHLCLGLSEGGGRLASRLICKDAVWEFAPVKDPIKILEDYFDLYWRGLKQPLPFFERTSYRYAFQKINKGKSGHEAYGEALKVWRGGYYQRGESEDAYHRKCFGDLDAVKPEFEQLASRIYQPVFLSANQRSMGSRYGRK